MTEAEFRRAVEDNLPVVSYVRYTPQGEALDFRVMDTLDVCVPRFGERYGRVQLGTRIFNRNFADIRLATAAELLTGEVQAPPVPAWISIPDFTGLWT